MDKQRFTMLEALRSIRKIAYSTDRDKAAAALLKIIELSEAGLMHDRPDTV